MKKITDKDLKWYHKTGMVLFLIVTAIYWIPKELWKLRKTTL